MRDPNFPACSLNGQYVEGYMQEGDIMIGILIDIFALRCFCPADLKFGPKKEKIVFSLSSLQLYRHLQAAIYAIEEINKSPNILPNMTLGFHIQDSWANEKKAISSIFSMLTGSNNYVPNYRCTQKGISTAFIGHLLSSVSNAMSQLTGLYGFPQVSYGAVDPTFSDRIRFPYFYRTVPSETARFKVVIQLIKMFGWNWVGIITSNDESYQKNSEDMRNEILKNGICVAYLFKIAENDYRTLVVARQTIIQSTANVVILYSRFTILLNMFVQMNDTRNHVWLMLSPLSSALGGLNLNIFNGSLVVYFHHETIPGLKDFLYKANPLRFPNDPFTAAVWLEIFACNAFSNSSFAFYEKCNANHTLKQYESYGYDVYNFRVTYSMYIAIYAVAHALHSIYTDKTSGGTILYSDKTTYGLMPTQLNHYLKKIHFKTPSGGDISFNHKGEVLRHFDILNWNIFHNGTVAERQVGTFISSSIPELVMDKEAIFWAPRFNGIPTSRCSASCSPGYRKSLMEGKHICCYDCVKCSEGEISSVPDMETCIKCHEDQWSNEKRSKCIMRTIDFLSYQDILGLALTIVALFLSSCTSAVFYIFIKYRKSPIVKANNQELSYILLLSLLVSFLCSLLFIGRPTKVSCLLRQAAFAIDFAICVSSILGKTVTVIIAFKATRPGSRLRNYVGARVPKYILILCTLPEVFICSFWLIISPPFPENDTRSGIGKIILQCNEGSTVAFYCMFGYISFLAFVSFFVAYLARKLPAIFNEAQYITFSMLLFCSVWISFILAYVSTKGKYLAAVEIFSIHISSAGLLVLIFIPKCYIIIIKPTLSTRGHLLEYNYN
ncbi:vomeronasal type-2 receptor 26 [Xenopus laevis]|uniref:Vomeronasal type-2 receptor 26 n=1 Tax=Xenopus laevis TaxID=8355 RepID=A0A8J0TKJ3_XENLA|nr:vomeronasal type-2 receptor 26 [Xenopus laevis]